MTKTIGLVCEGPRDRELLMAVIDSLFPKDHFENKLSAAGCDAVIRQL